MAKQKKFVKNWSNSTFRFGIISHHSDQKNIPPHSDQKNKPLLMSFFWLVYLSDERADRRRGFRPIYRDMIITQIELNTVRRLAL